MLRKFTCVKSVFHRLSHLLLKYFTLFREYSHIAWIFALLCINRLCCAFPAGLIRAGWTANSAFPGVKWWLKGRIGQALSPRADHGRHLPRRQLCFVVSVGSSA